jgi:serine protease Do
MKRFVLSVAMGTVCALAQAQEGQAAKPINPLGFLSAIFSPKPAALTKLLDEKKLTDVDTYLASEKQYFLVDYRKDQDALLRRVAEAFNGMYEPEMDRLTISLQVADPLRQDQWREHKESLKKAETLLKDYRGLTIFSVQDFVSTKLMPMEAALMSSKAKATNAGPAAFLGFNHTASDDFFESFPVSLEQKFLAKHANSLTGFIDSLDAGQVRNLKAKYSRQIESGDRFDELLSARFLRLSLPQDAAPHPIGKVLIALKSARDAGFNVKKVPASQIAFVEATSKTLLAEGQIEFPTQIQMDLPFEPVKAELDQVIETTDRIGSNIVIVLDVAASKVSRRITAKSDESSRFVSGQRSEHNPAYDVARSKVFEAQSGLARARAQYTGSLAAAIINGIAIGMWQDRFTAAQREMAGTPTTLQVDEFKDYKYSYSDVTSTRALTANYYVIDKTTRRYYKGTFDVTESKSFRIAYNVHDKDPQRGSILGRYGKESDIESYEKAPMALAVSTLIEDYLKNEAQSKPLPDLVALRSEMLADKNKALTAYKDSQFTAKAVKDPRFDSVVVVNNPKGALGTGFFVAPDLVLTNFHVIEGVQFLEMKLHNGLETFGKVVKTDVRLDLALIRVQTRGTPVNFFEGSTLELGATVDAIGHPKGLTFTVTRGVVSAVRKRQSIFGVGGKEVLFVQTDAAINPGNSGGPLFLGDRLIGVNNNKMVAGSEGLGFSIHYSEVKEFLKESF